MVILKITIFFMIILFIFEIVLSAFSNLRNIFAFNPYSKLVQPFKVNL